MRSMSLPEMSPQGGTKALIGAGRMRSRSGSALAQSVRRGLSLALVYRN